MNAKDRFGASSSLFASIGGLLVLTLGLILSLRFKASLLAGIFLFFLLLSLLARFWGARAIGKVTVGVHCPKPRLFPGQTTTLTYEVTNGKWLPLAWLELAQNGPEGDCLRPDEGFVSYEQPGYQARDPKHLRQCFSFVGPYQTLTVDTLWHARRRGLYPITDLTARTGDGFGLVQREHPLPQDQRPTLAVYPRQVEVDLSLFLSPQWDCVSGRQGWSEDNTVLRGNREYQPGDNWKHINWRMAAREQGLPLNLYETIQPRGMRFILDGESFCEDEAGLERTLEVLGSVVTGLAGAGIDCSLTLPRSRRYAAANLTGGADELLLHLAGYDCLKRRHEDAPGYLPSLFPAGAVPQVGTTFLLTRSGAALPDALVGQLDPGKSWVLSLEDCDAPRRLGLRAMALEGLLKGGDGL